MAVAMLAILQTIFIASCSVLYSTVKEQGKLITCNREEVMSLQKDVSYIKETVAEIKTLVKGGS